MAKTSYPSAKNLKDFLLVSELKIKDESILENALAGAISYWEKSTGWRPFLASKHTSVQKYAFPRNCGWSSRGGVRILELDNGLVELKKITISGSKKDLTETADFSLMPFNATANNRPYEWIEFHSGLCSPGEFLEIEGKWGYQKQVPSEVWNAIIKLAACDCLELHTPSSAGKLVSWSEGDVSEKYHPSSIDQLLEHWKKDTQQLMKKYQRFKLGV